VSDAPRNEREVLRSWLIPPEGPEQRPAPSSSPEKWAVDLEDADQWVLMVMYGLKAPFIGYPGWGDDPQFWEPHKTRITMLRLAHAPEIARTGMALEWEAMLYLSSATLAGPPTREAANLYFHLFHRCMGEKADGLDIPDPKLEPDEEALLLNLRRWIFKQQWAHLKAKAKGEQAQEREPRQLTARMERLL
jgi:hypothetical protein